MEKEWQESNGVNLLFWKTNRKRLICLLKDISASLFLVSAPRVLDLLDLESQRNIYTVEILKIVFSSILLFPRERIGESIYSITVNNPLPREVPLYLARFISQNQQTAAIHATKDIWEEAAMRWTYAQKVFIFWGAEARNRSVGGL